MRRDHKRVSLEKEMSIHVLNRSLALVNFSEPPLDSLPIISARLSLASLISSFLEGLMAGRFHLLLVFLPVFLKYFTGCFATCVWLSKCLIFTGRTFFFLKTGCSLPQRMCATLCFFCNDKKCFMSWIPTLRFSLGIIKQWLISFCPQPKCFRIRLSSRDFMRC